MGETTKIQWADHTMNPWRGCSKVAEGCANCYANAQAKRNPGTLGIWGPNGTRVVASESMWREPLKWNREAQKQREAWSEDCAERESLTFPGRPPRPRVFCGSMCDWAEDWNGPMVDSRGRQLLTINGDEWFTEREYPDCRPLTLNDVRRRLFRLIDDTPELDWLLLTKRPENIARMWESTGTTCDQVNRRHNVWLGTSIACQDDAERNIPHLLRCGETVPVLFLSIEPLVGPVELAKWLGGRSCRGHGDDPDSLEQCETGCDYDPPDFDFVTVGGESGPNARPCRVEWIRDIVRQCREAGVPCFVKQLGANVIDDSGESRCSWPGLTKFQWDRVLLRDPKGGDPSEWPEDLKVREVPSTVC